MSTLRTDLGLLRSASLLLIAVLFFQGILFAQARTGVVTGKLLSADGRPAAGVRVTALAPPDRERSSGSAALVSIAETDADGRYSLQNIPPGSYYIAAGMVEFPTYYPGITGPVGATIVNVTAGSALAGIDFRVARVSVGLTVSGRVVHESNRQLGGPGQVTLSPSAGGQPLTATVGLDETFSFQKVRPDTYRLSVNQPPPGFQPKNIVVGENDVTGLELIVPWTVDVDGAVTVESGEPVPEITVSFASGLRGKTQVTAQEMFRWPLAEGSYGVMLTEIPAGYFIKSITSGDTDLRANPLRVSRATTPPRIAITLGVTTPAPWVKMSGRLTGLRNRTPSDRIRITLSGRNGGNLEAVVNPDGSFEFPRILPGEYGAFINPLPISTPPITVLVPNSDLIGVEIAVPPTREVSGRIVVEDDGPLPRVMLSLSGAVGAPLPLSSTSLPQLFVTGTPRDELTVGVSPQPDGGFRVSLPEGEYRLAMRLQAGNGTVPYELKSFTYGARDLQKSPIMVTAADSEELRLTFSPTVTNSWSKVSGRVTGLDAEILTRNAVKVTMSSNAVNASMTAAVNADGSFEFPRVYRGRYAVRLSSPIALVGSPTTNVDVENKDLSGVEIALPRQKEVAGRLVIEGAGAAAMPRIGMPLIASGSQSMLNINPQPDGTFRLVVPEGERQVGGLSGLPAGFKLKSFTYGDSSLLQNPLRVALTDTAEFRLTLTPVNVLPVKISGRVSGLDGAARAAGSVNVTLTDSFSARILSAPIGVDGAFEFPAVVPGSYTARVDGTDILSSPVIPVAVTSLDIRDIEIVVPGRKEVRGRITINGPAPLPRLALRLATAGSPGNPSNTDTLNLDAQADGTFRVTLPEGEYRLNITALPRGYALTSLLYGSTDLSRNSIKISRADNADLQVMLTATELAPVRVSGRAPGGARLSMTSSGYAATMNATAKTDGTFEFPAVFPGTYVLRLAGSGIPASACAGVAVADWDVQNVDIAGTDDIRIVSAIYGSIRGSADVTPIVRKLTRPGVDEFYAAPQWLQVDPARSQTKTLAISYLYQCREQLFSTSEPGAVSHAILVAHANSVNLVAPPVSTGDELVIVNALYGSGAMYDSVTSQVRELLRPGRDPFVPNNTMSGTAARANNELIVTYLYKGRRSTFYSWSDRLVSYAMLVANAESGGPPDKHSNEAPVWLKDAEPDAPLEPGELGPGFGRSPRWELAIAALLKAHAELKAILPEERTADLIGTTFVVQQALAEAQAGIPNPYPSPTAKPVLPARRVAPQSVRVANAVKFLNTAITELNAAAGNGGNRRTNAIAGIGRALEELQKAAAAR